MVNRNLWDIDSRINNLESQLLGVSDDTPLHHIAVTYDRLVSLWYKKANITLGKQDLAMACTYNFQALNIGQQAISAFRNGDVPNLGALWALQGDRHNWNLEQAEEESACDQAISSFNSALRYLSSSEASFRNEVHINRMNLLGRRYERDGNSADIVEALRVGEHQISRCSEQHRAAVYNDVAIIYQLCGGIPQLERAIALHQVSQQLETDTKLLVRRTINLNISRNALYKLTHTIDHLWLAHEELKQAITLCESSSLADVYPDCLVRWGLTKYRLFTTGAGEAYKHDALVMVQMGLRHARNDEVKDDYERLVQLVAKEINSYPGHGTSINRIAAAIRNGQNPVPKW